MKGRLAPSPTGDLHVGGAATFLVAWLEARAAGGTLAMRVEDIDTARARADFTGRIFDDLRWLGLDWDGAEVIQSTRLSAYESALATLAAEGRTYLCDCSRAEVARAASAPHAGDEGPRYPGTCRDARPDRAFKRAPAVRFRVEPSDRVRVRDLEGASAAADVIDETSDFVLRRGDGVFAYQLAVVVDDAAMGIDAVVRGNDLRSSTARQVLLFQHLAEDAPAFLHTPLMVGEGGERLAKRDRASPIRAHRALGAAPEDVVGALAHALGLTDRETSVHPRDLVAGYDRRRLSGPTISVPRSLRDVPGRAQIA